MYINNIPKIIWMYWEQGWNNAPFVIHKCLETQYFYNSDFDIRLLDNENLYNYIELPDLIKQNKFPIQLFSDILRTALLKKYGGIWCDATLFFQSPLSHWIEEATKESFFAFYNNIISSWFIASSNDNCIINSFYDYFLKRLHDEFENYNHYFQSWGGNPYYYLWHSTFKSLYDNNKDFKDTYDRIKKIHAFGPLEFTYRGLNSSIDDTIASDIIRKKEKLYKLNWRIKNNDDKNSIINFLFSIFEAYRANIKNLNTFSEIGHEHYAKFKTLPQSIFDMNKSDYKYSGFFDVRGNPHGYKDIHPWCHIINMAHRNQNNHNAQILIPFCSQRAFLRTANGKGFLKPKEFAFKDDIKSLKDEITMLKDHIQDIEKLLKK